MRLLVDVRIDFYAPKAAQISMLAECGVSEGNDRRSE